MATATTTEKIPQEIIDACFECCRGQYQKNLLDGVENWSGSSLTGSAKGTWGASYNESRKNLIRRIQDRLDCECWEAETELRLIRSRWHRVLVLTDADGNEYIW